MLKKKILKMKSNFVYLIFYDFEQEYKKGFRF